MVARPAASRRAADASMTLLKEVMERPLDPGYAAAARAREAAGAGSPRSGRRAPLTVALSVLAGLVLVTGVVQLRSPRAADTAEQLRQQITTRTEEVAARDASIVAADLEIATLRDAELAGSDTALLEQVQLLGLLAGTSAATGPGAVYTLDDSLASQQPVPGDPRTEEEISQGKVFDVDLQQVTNGLWAAGAEAISINGHRLTSTSAIRGAGDAILVDLRPLARPYEVQAVGDPSRMQTAFARSDAGRYLSSLEQNNGVQVTIRGADDLALDPTGRLGLRYARPVQPTDGTGTPARTDTPAPTQEATP